MPARRFPVLTAVATVVALAAAAAQYAVPSMVPALQRVPGTSLQADWWRLFTPVLVQTLGWYQVAANLLTLPVLGAIAERMLGRAWWLALAAAGTAGGQLAAYHWNDPGGGDSSTICGLAAGVLVVLLARPRAGPRLAHLAVVFYVAALTGWGCYGTRGAALACAATAACLAGARLVRLPAADRIALTCCILAAVALVVFERDLHGASLLAGVAFTAAVVAAGARGHAEPRPEEAQMSVTSA